MNVEGIGEHKLRHIPGSLMRAGQGSEGKFLGQMPTVKGSQMGRPVTPGDPRAGPSKTFPPDSHPPSLKPEAIGSGDVDLRSTFRRT